MNNVFCLIILTSGTNDTERALEVIKSLAERQGTDGSLRRSATSVTRSTGKCLAVETTSLALIAFLRADPSAFSENIDKSVKFLVKSMNQGFWGSTQSTILAMRALIEFQNKNKTSEQRFAFGISINDAQKTLQILPEKESSTRNSISISISIYSIDFVYT